MERIELQNKINSFGVEVTFAESEVPTQFLTAEISKIKSDDVYLEKIAREKFQMVKPGEKVFRVVDKKKIK